jgi:hypothetical protein
MLHHRSLYILLGRPRRHVELTMGQGRIAVQMTRPVMQFRSQAGTDIYLLN